MLEHVGSFEEDTDDHGAEEEAKNGEVDCGVGFLGGYHSEHDHEHGAQERAGGSSYRQEWHGREDGQDPEDPEGHGAQHHLYGGGQRHLAGFGLPNLSKISGHKNPCAAKIAGWPNLAKILRWKKACSAEDAEGQIFHASHDRKASEIGSQQHRTDINHA